MGLISFLKKLFGGGKGDRTLRCAQCESDFVFEAGEQAFFAERGLSDPKRCGPCRKEKRGKFRGGRGRGRGR